jgi:isochorismate synthase
MSDLHSDPSSLARPVLGNREVETLLDTARRQPGTLVRVSVPAARVSAAAVSTLAETAFIWEPSEAQAWVGLDETRRYQASGPTRFESIRDQVNTDLDGSSELRVFGGFAFADGVPDARWAEFGEALFVLPRFTYESDPTGSNLSVVLTREELTPRGNGSQHLKELLRIRALLHDLPVPSGEVENPTSVRDLSSEGWAALVSDILALIDAGGASKIVAARRTELEFSRPISVAATLETLRRQATGSTCFALRLGDTAWLGATPERLVRKHGTSLESEALAGTFRTTGSALADELLRSPKEHREHLPVLDAIVAALGPLCREISHPEQPQLRELPDLLHLRTPITAELAAPVHVLDLVARLHPTPAVGGVPTHAALRWIGESEHAERGWYAGPVGWFDGFGDGDFQVALRSGLLRTNQATLYAGAGIVRGSEAASEYAETDLKLRALRRSLRFE